MNELRSVMNTKTKADLLLVFALAGRATLTAELGWLT